MRVFLDFEASSLSDDSYPIEVGWVSEDGRGESRLIRPIAAWTDWSVLAEGIHGISREELMEKGLEPAAVAGEMLARFKACRLYASAPSWDGKWLSVLLRGGGFPRHALRLADSEAAFLEAAVEVLGPGRQDEARALVSRTREDLSAATPAHRAQADAERERRIWLEVRARAQALR